MIIPLLNSLGALNLLRFRPKQAPVNDSPISDELRAVIEERIKPGLDQLEAQRQHYFEQYEKRNKVLKYFAFPAALVFGGVQLANLHLFEALLYPLLALLFVNHWVNKPARDYIAHYKSSVLPILVKLYGDFTYAPKSEFDPELDSRFKVVPRFERWSSEDAIKGKLDDIGFEFCELHLKVKTKDSTRTVFKGGMISLTMPFEFGAHVIMHKDKGALGNLFARGALSHQTVALENPNFEARYEVRANDQQLARYILSPAMMERLIALDDLFRENVQGSGLMCEFVGNTALLMLPYSGNLMEPTDIHTSAYELEKLPLIAQEIALLSGVVEQLKLDYMATRKLAMQQLSQGQLRQ